jgi:flagellar biosynthesis chaperone FliJ
MTHAAALARLVGLRRLREQSALNALTQCEGECRRAEQQIKAAQEAIAFHLVQARMHEQNKRQALFGRAVSSGEIARLQADLDAMAAEAMRLRKVEEDARAALHDAEQARDAARERYRLCQRAVIKLDKLAEQERRKAERLETAYAEADLEERAIMAAASASEQSWA